MRQFGQAADKAAHSPRRARTPLPSQDATSKNDEKKQKMSWWVDLRATENEGLGSYVQTAELGPTQELSLP